ncbi:MAG: hypothetical protein E4G90_04550 [Gemmatimonadales bacterium]|nr:MAG: hypothetical protein E4G90_04550 [Gemmatimonadales bacterium]
MWFNCGTRATVAALAVTWMVAGCNSAPAAGPGSTVQPLGLDTQQPFPIDRGDDGTATPGTYKGLWLRLIDNGEPQITAVDGVIGVVCVGMSNSNQECADWILRLDAEYAPEVNPAVRVINCAVGGHAIEKWIDPAFDGTLWDDCLGRRLTQAGVRPDQVLVIYHKAADQFTTATGGGALPTYPAAGSDFENFHTNLSVFSIRVKVKFPFVRAVYTSSRSYGGFANTAGRGEPLSYEEGHALNLWLDENRSVDGVWYGWGPYLWAPSCTEGMTNKGGICYDRADYVADGVHPSATGQAKVSQLIHSRLRQDAWYMR